MKASEYLRETGQKFTYEEDAVLELIRSHLRLRNQRADFNRQINSLGWFRRFLFHVVLNMRHFPYDI